MESNSFLTARPSESSAFAPTKIEYVDTQENQTALNPQPIAEAEPVLDADGNIVAPPAEPIKTKVDVKKMADLVKLERRLAKKEADAKALLEKASSIQGAFDDADLVSALQKIGLNPDEVYKKMTKYAVDKMNEKPTDPIQAELQATKKQLEEYKASQDKMLKDLNDERAMSAHQQAMTQKVAPVINENPDAYEVLIATFGGKDQAIAKVYEECYNEFCRSGTVIDPKEAAEAMENYFYEVQEQALTNASKLNKFKKHFNQAELEKTTEALETGAESFTRALSAKLDSPPALDKPNQQAKTLTNNMGSISAKPAIQSSGKVDHLARFLKEKGIV